MEHNLHGRRRTGQLPITARRVGAVLLMPVLAMSFAGCGSTIRQTNASAPKPSPPPEAPVATAEPPEEYSPHAAEDGLPGPSQDDSRDEPPTSSSPPSPPSPPSRTTPPTRPPTKRGVKAGAGAADGTNLAACRDGACEVAVKPGDVIRFGRRAKVGPELRQLKVIRVGRDGATLRMPSGTVTTSHGRLELNSLRISTRGLRDGRAILKITHRG